MFSFLERYESVSHELRLINPLNHIFKRAGIGMTVYRNDSASSDFCGYPRLTIAAAYIKPYTIVYACAGAIRNPHRLASSFIDAYARNISGDGDEWETPRGGFGNQFTIAAVVMSDVRTVGQFSYSVGDDTLPIFDMQHIAVRNREVQVLRNSGIRSHDSRNTYAQVYTGYSDRTAVTSITLGLLNNSNLVTQHASQIYTHRSRIGQDFLSGYGNTDLLTDLDKNQNPCLAIFIQN